MFITKKIYFSDKLTIVYLCDFNKIVFEYEKFTNFFGIKLWLCPLMFIKDELEYPAYSPLLLSSAGSISSVS